MAKKLDLSVEEDRKAWALANVMRSAMDLPDALSIAAIIGAALAQGWTMDRPLPESQNSGMGGLPLPLPHIAARMGAWGEEGLQGRVPLIEALSELGVDWNQSYGENHRGHFSSPMMEAAEARNWRVATAMAERGGSWLGAPAASSAAEAAMSPMALLWANARIDKFGEQGDVHVDRALASSASQLWSAVEAGEASAAAWFPVLTAAKVAGSAGWGGKSSQARAKTWAAWFKGVAGTGAARWDGPLAAEGATPRWLPSEIDWLEKPTAALALARAAVSDCDAIAEALRSAPATGFELDPRSGWALAAAARELGRQASHPLQQARGARAVGEALERLKPWREGFAQASATPRAMPWVSAARGDWKEFKEKQLNGWGGACALFCAPPPDARAELRVGAALGAHTGAGRKAQAEAVEAALDMARWMGFEPGSPRWAGFEKEFAREFAESAMSDGAVGVRIDEDGDAQDRDVAERARCAMLALSVLSRDAERGGSRLAAAALERIGKLVGAAAKDYDDGAGAAVALMAKMALELVWADPVAPKRAWLAWEKELDAVAKAAREHGDEIDAQAVGAARAGLSRAAMLAEVPDAPGSAGSAPGRQRL